MTMGLVGGHDGPLWDDESSDGIPMPLMTGPRCDRCGLMLDSGLGMELNIKLCRKGELWGRNVPWRCPPEGTVIDGAGWAEAAFDGHYQPYQEPAFKRHKPGWIVTGSDGSQWVEPARPRCIYGNPDCPIC